MGNTNPHHAYEDFLFFMGCKAAIEMRPLERFLMVTSFVSESVAAGHPDKICDQISDAVVDAALTADSKSRVAVETLVTTNRIVLAGEVTCKKSLPYEKIARNVIKSLGYTKKEYGFWNKSPISVYIHEQSPDIALGVDDGGAGDQGMMFGYACSETPEYMPAPIMIAHRIVEYMDMVREKNILSYLRPDGKCEVNIGYVNGKPTNSNRLVIAVPHDRKVEKSDVLNDLFREVVRPVFEHYKMKSPSVKDIILNGTGQWEIGGPASDTGVTGRKIIVDTYGGYARHGGGAFSGKDPTKVDRSAAYAARFIAKNIVASGLAEKAEVRLAYAIGYRDPIEKVIDVYGTGKRGQKTIERKAWGLLDLSVKGIIEGLSLRRPIYQKTAAYGHFGRDGFPWEQVVQ
jgi:S-adenosylmethionine synthetase